MNGAEAFAKVKQVGIIPAIRTSDASAAVLAADAICSGGIPIIEISMALPGALEVLKAVVRAYGEHMLIGAGTVVSCENVRQASQLGAQFIVTTGLTPLVIETARDCGVAAFAGAMTPTELQLAAASQPEAVKLFPCYAVGGPQYVKTLRGQYPNVDLIASGGVTLENCAAYFQAGVCAIGVGGEIADTESMAKGNHRIFLERARRFRKVITDAQARPGNGSA